MAHVMDMQQINGGSLAGHLLIATPSVQGSCFTRSVIYLCAHNAAGAMGMIVNYPVENVHLKDIFDQVGIAMQQDARNLPVHFGGPVEANRGFVVHSGDYYAADSQAADGSIVVTSSLSILQALAQGQGPKQGMLALGYAGWAAGQLESEIESGSWIVAPATETLVFATPNDVKWGLAIASVGIDLGHLSTDVGHA